jgi:hypothetical protein
MVKDLKSNKQISTMDRQILDKLIRVLGVNPTDETDQMIAEKLAKVLSARLTGSKINGREHAAINDAGVARGDDNGRRSLTTFEGKNAGKDDSDALIRVLGELEK